MTEYVKDPRRSDVWNKKRAYGHRLRNLLDNADKVFCVSVDNVGSKQMQQIRYALRGKADVIMGKNTTIRKVLRDFLADNADHPTQALMPLVNGNVGFVFTSGDVTEVRDILVSNRVPAPARVGAIAPVDVIVPAGPTGCDPGQTSWFQALQIATKINRGQIEIISDVPLVAAGEKVGNSEAALLQKLSINPFTYGIVVNQVYDNGEVFDPQVLDLSEDDLLGKLASGISAVAALSLAIGFPTLASLPHSLSNAFKHCVAIALETEFTFEKAEAWKEFMANPGAFAPAGGAGGGGGAAAAEEAPKEESEKEESVGGAGGMFEDDDDWQMRSRISRGAAPLRRRVHVHGDVSAGGRWGAPRGRSRGPGRGLLPSIEGLRGGTGVGPAPARARRPRHAGAAFTCGGRGRVVRARVLGPAATATRPWQCVGSIWLRHLAHAGGRTRRARQRCTGSEAGATCAPS